VTGGQKKKKKKRLIHRLGCLQRGGGGERRGREGKGGRGKGLGSNLIIVRETEGCGFGNRQGQPNDARERKIVMSPPPIKKKGKKSLRSKMKGKRKRGTTTVAKVSKKGDVRLLSPSRRLGCKVRWKRGKEFCQDGEDKGRTESITFPSKQVRCIATSGA